MASETAGAPRLISDFMILARCRTAQVRNLLDQQLRDAPGRTFITAALLVVIWAALYVLLTLILTSIQRWGVVSVVVYQYIFVHFFLVLSVMLAFSNAVLAFGNLYSGGEATALLAMPARARQVVTVKWLEGIALSSWAFLLLGVPLMLALAGHGNVEWYFYPLFVAHFVGFVVIPANLGLLAACAVALWAPRRPGATAIWLGSVLVLLALLWLSNVSREALTSGEWLQVVMRQSLAAMQPWIPSTWTAKGVVSAIEHRPEDSLFYLGVTLGNAVFLSWLTVNLLGTSWSEAYNRAQYGRFTPTLRRGWITELVCFALFFYMPRRLRMVILKDLRGFVRDAKQWTQMVIMFGLLIIYAMNLSRLPLDVSGPMMRGLIAFLNLTTISLILATFTSRFVYPLLSLESQQLWLVGLLPVRRVQLLVAKFVFALTITGLAALCVMGLAVNVLELPPAWARLHLLVCGGVCIGLCGLAVGLGARFPVLGQRNPARIASGFGGTFNLIASMLFVFIEMGGVALLSLNELFGTGSTLHALSMRSVVLGAALVCFGLAVAAGALWVGGRKFARLEV